jgi:hypothetical protein
MNIKTSYTTCPLCEAICGLEITTRGQEILSIRGDTQMPSCPAWSAFRTDGDTICLEPVYVSPASMLGSM